MSAQCNSQYADCTNDLIATANGKCCNADTYATKMVNFSSLQHTALGLFVLASASIDA